MPGKEAPQPDPPPTDAANWQAHFGSLRAAALVTCMLVLPALALIGPDRLYDMVSGLRIAADRQAIAQEKTTHAAHYSEPVAPPEPSAAQVAPRLATVNEGHGWLGASPQGAVPGQRPSDVTPPGASLRSTPATPDSANSEIALAGHVDSPQSPPAANYSFREPTAAATDRMQAIQQRLQLLGARYMLLESWGDVAPRYRFQCRLANRHGEIVKYESVSDDPLHAMQRVLYQVEERIAGR